MMRQYELMLVLRSDIDISDEKKKEAMLTKLLGSDVSIKDSVDMGSRALSYEIKKSGEGRYLLVHFQKEAVKTGEFEKKVKLFDGVLRYLFVRVD